MKKLFFVLIINFLMVGCFEDSADLSIQESRSPPSQELKTDQPGLDYLYLNIGYTEGYGNFVAQFVYENPQLRVVANNNNNSTCIPALFDSVVTTTENGSTTHYVIYRANITQQTMIFGTGQLDIYQSQSCICGGSLYQSKPFIKNVPVCDRNYFFCPGPAGQEYLILTDNLYFPTIDFCA